MVKSIVLKTGLTFAVLVLAIFAANLALQSRQTKRAHRRSKVLPVTIRKAQPIIAAIARYQKQLGTSPPTLQTLVPKYLKSIPAPGPAAQGSWRYRVFAGTKPKDYSLSIRVRDEFSPNLVGFGDTFVFHSDGNYRNADYGGGLRRFKNWGYYVE